MGLSAYTERSDSFKLPAADGEQEIVVYGLSFADLVCIVQRFEETITPLYAQYVSGVRLTVADILRTAAAESPVLLAYVIAAGCRDLEAIEAAMRLPAGITAEAVEKILTLTIQGEHNLKKVQEIIGEMVGRVQSLGPLSHSANGIGASVKP